VCEADIVFDQNRSLICSGPAAKSFSHKVQFLFGELLSLEGELAAC